MLIRHTDIVGFWFFGIHGILIKYTIKINVTAPIVDRSLVVIGSLVARIQSGTSKRGCRQRLIVIVVDFSPIQAIVVTIVSSLVTYFSWGISTGNDGTAEREREVG